MAKYSRSSRGTARTRLVETLSKTLRKLANSLGIYSQPIKTFHMERNRRELPSDLFLLLQSRLAHSTHSEGS